MKNKKKIPTPAVPATPKAPVIPPEPTRQRHPFEAKMDKAVSDLKAKWKAINGGESETK